MEKRKTIRSNRAKTIFLTAVSLLLVAILSFVGCAKAPEPTAVYATHTALQAAYLSGETAYIDSFAKGLEELSRPLPVVLDTSEISDDIVKVEFSKNFSFKDATTCPVQDGIAEIYNLEIGTVYYWRGVRSDGSRTNALAFCTEDVAPRNLYVDGVTNVRDLGGRTVAEGRIRQGLLFRGGRLHAKEVEITGEGIRTMRETLGIKTEIDLRRADNNENNAQNAGALGEGVTYLSFPMVASDDMLIANDESIRAVFARLADESNYPLFYHCSIGTDRTGYVSFLILALLGADIDDIQRDYLFSNFGKIGGDRNIFNVMGFELYLTTFFNAATLQDKAELYLLSIGVTPEEIASFRTIMIEENA